MSSLKVDCVRASLTDASKALDALLNNEEMLERVARAAQLIADSQKAGGAVYSCGNGGSLCDAMHFAEEMTGRYRSDRKPYRAMADEYLKRLSRFGKTEEIELPDLPEPVNSSPAIEKQIKDKEGEAILAKIRPGDYVIALTIPGKQWDSPGLSDHLNTVMERGNSSLV